MIRDGKGHDDIFNDLAIMKQMGWSWNDLNTIPERVYLSAGRILSLQAKHAEQEREKAKREGQKKGMGVK